MNNDKHPSYQQQFFKIIKLVPAFNLIYDIFIDENYPTTDKLKYILDSFGLISALLLVSVTACIVTINFDELTQADIRFSNDAIGAGRYYQYWNKYYSVPPSSQLYNNVSTSILLLFLAIGTIIYVNIDLLSKKNQEEEKERKYILVKNNSNNDDRFDISTISNPDIDNTENEEKDIVKKDIPYNRWWRFTKWNFLIIFACLVGGCFYSFYTFVVLLSIKYPDYYVNNHGDATTTTDSPYGRNSTISFIATVAVMAFVVISSGIGTAYYHLQLDEDEEDAKYKAEVERIERKRLKAEKLREEKLKEIENAMATLDSLAMDNGDDDELVVGGRLEESKLLNKSSRKKPTMIHNTTQPMFCNNCNQAGNSYVLPYDDD